jgi:uncharacterized phage protein (TIGR01671 family)
MREIKFRYWDLEYKHWVELPCLIGDYQANSYRTYGDPFPLSSFMHGEYQERLKDGLLVIQQYTGLKDKNGKEVYEGDIIAIRDTTLNFNVMVEWKSIGWSAETPNGNNAFIWMDLYERFEVIGNIFENRELLEYERN